MTEPTAYPLDWPPGFPRTKAWKQRRARFHREGNLLTVGQALERLRDECRRLGAALTVVSSNIPLRRDGFPRSDRSQPNDVGVAVYFTLKGKPHCLPSDRWDRVADNIAAVAGHIAATRTIERYGVGDLERAFMGFQALPSPDTRRPWHQVLNVEPDAEPATVHAKWRQRLRETHPDHGGSDAQAAEVNAAWDEYRAQAS